MKEKHESVLLKEVIDYLDPKPDENFIDCTVGAGGHSQAILQKIGPNGKLIGFDLDQLAHQESQERLKSFGERIVLKRSNFADLEKTINESFPLLQFSGILFDLGLSQFELADKTRGFSFQIDGPLDMRFSGEGTTAADILNNASFEKLSKIFLEYGEDKYYKTLARKLIELRRKQKFNNTKQLVEAVLQVYRDILHSKKEIPWIGGNHPATKVFQALRIEVNDELNNLSGTLPQALRILKPAGRLVVISFHSLEDRIVKDFFRREARDCLCDPVIPVCQCGHQASLKILTKKPVVAGRDEQQTNLQSRSAKLRAAVKL